MDDQTRTAVERWMQRATNDLRTAQTMLDDDPPTTDTVCFHAQQAVEKCLKAYLTMSGQHVERTHDLVRLTILCQKVDSDFDALRTAATELSDYAVTSRYPDGWRDIPTGEARAAVGHAETAMRFVERKLSR